MKVPIDLLVALTADGQRAITTGDDTVWVWDLRTGTLERTMEVHKGQWGRAVAVTADGQRAITTGSGTKDTRGWRGAVRVWDLRTGAQSGR